MSNLPEINWMYDVVPIPKPPTTALKGVAECEGFRPAGGCDSHGSVKKQYAFLNRFCKRCTAKDECLSKILGTVPDHYDRETPGVRGGLPQGIVVWKLRELYGEWRRRKCSHCGTWFKTVHPNLHTCSRPCWSAYRNAVAQRRKREQPIAS